MSEHEVNADLAAGGGIACLLAVILIGGIRDALERGLHRYPELIELLHALYRDLAVAVFAVMIISLIQVLQPSITIFLVAVLSYVALVLIMVTMLQTIVVRTWHRWDREALRAAISDLQNCLHKETMFGSRTLATSKAKVAWLMCREIFIMQFISGNSELSGFSYVRYLRLSLSDVCLSFLPMGPSACIVIAAGIAAAWGQTSLVNGSEIYLLLIWEVISLLYLIHTLRHLSYILTRFLIDPNRFTSSQLAAFLSLGQGQEDNEPEQEATRRNSAPLPLFRKLSDKLRKPPHAVVSISQPDEGIMKSVSEMDPDNPTISDFSKNAALPRDSALMSTTRLSGTPRPHYAPSEPSHRISTLTENEQSTRRPYVSNTDYSATYRQHNSRNGSITPRPVTELSLGRSHGRGSMSAYSVMTPRARLSTTSMNSQMPRTIRMRTEPEVDPNGKLSFRVAVKLMLLRKRATSYAQASILDPQSSGSGRSQSHDSMEAATDLVRMFGGSEAAQAMSAELPGSLRWWASPGPSAILKATHSNLALDAIVLAATALTHPLDVYGIVFLLVAIVTFIKLYITALLLRDFTIVTSSGSMARVELMSLSSRKLAEYERGLKYNSVT